MKLIGLTILATVIACARIPENVTPRPVPGRSVQVADYVTFIHSTEEWERSRWYRIGDPFDTVGFFVVSVNGAICLGEQGAWAISHHGDLYECPGVWRPSSGVGGMGSRLPNQ